MKNNNYSNIDIKNTVYIKKHVLNDLYESSKDLLCFWSNYKGQWTQRKHVFVAITGLDVHSIQQKYNRTCKYSSVVKLQVR